MIKTHVCTWMEEVKMCGVGSWTRTANLLGMKVCNQLPI